MRAILTTSLAALLFSPALAAQEAQAQRPAAKTWTSTDAYPLDTCVVSGRRFAGDKMQVVEVDGRKFKLCSAECAEKLRKDAAIHTAKLDQAVIDAQLGDYPLERCPISGKALGSMGEPVKLVLDNHLVQLCCKGCNKKAEAKKAEVIADIEAAAHAKQKGTYSMKKCPNTGEDLDPKATVEVMHGTTLLRFCCEDYIDELNKAPAKMLAKLHEARKEKTRSDKQEPKNEHEGHGKHEHGKEDKTKGEHGS